MPSNFLSTEHEGRIEHAGGTLEESMRGSWRFVVEDEVQEGNLRSGKVSITQYMEEMKNKSYIMTDTGKK